MINYKCKMCGGELELSGSGGMVCTYCGSKSFFSDEDFKGNETFRKKMLEYYKAEAAIKDNDYTTDKFWVCNDRDAFTMQNGQKLQIDYMKKYDYQEYTCYIARESVIYIFNTGKDSDAFLAGLNRLAFPEADDRLHRSFPEFKTGIKLEDGRQVLVFVRRPNVYPSEMFAPWESKHLAWVISRMENICCALAYSGIEHGGISPESVWINPVMHEGILFGDWRDVRTLTQNSDLKDLRKTAIHLAKNTRDPKEMYAFLNSAPEKDAFSDFEKWDRVIEDGFGGHRFIKMN